MHHGWNTHHSALLQLRLHADDDEADAGDEVDPDSGGRRGHLRTPLSPMYACRDLPSEGNYEVDDDDVFMMSQLQNEAHNKRRRKERTS